MPEKLCNGSVCASDFTTQDVMTSSVRTLLFILFGIMYANSVSGAVIGSDDRRPVVDAKRFPYRAVGLIHTDDSTCSATLIGPKHILTAAHCLFDVKHSKDWKLNPHFVPGQNDIADEPYGKTMITRAYLYRAYVNKARNTGSIQSISASQFQNGFDEFVLATMHQDIAVAELAKPIGESVGWLGLKVQRQNEPAPFIQVAGYPIDKGRYSQWSADCQTRWQAPLLEHRCDLTPGMSGAAGVVKAFDDTYYIAGVYAMGHPRLNYLIPITEQGFDQINAWRSDSLDKTTVVHQFKPPSTTPLIFANSCPNAVQVALYYMAANGQWTATSWREVRPGQRRTLANNKDAVFYLYAESTFSQKARWEGKAMHRSIAGSAKEYGFQRVVLEETQTPYVHEFSCTDK